MAIVSNNIADSFISKSLENITVFLLHGNEKGLIQDRAQAIIDNVKANKQQIQIVNIQDNELKNTPNILIEEANSFSLFASLKIIVVDANIKDITNQLQRILIDPPISCKIIIKTEILSTTSSLRQLVEKSKFAVAIANYPDNQSILNNLIDKQLDDFNIDIAKNARQRLVSLLGRDRMLSKQELEKLMLYSYGEKIITLKMIDNIITDASSFSLSNVIDSAFLGCFQQIEQLIQSQDINYNILIFALTQHSLLLLKIKGELPQVKDINSIMQKTKFIIHFSRQDNLKKQIQLWSIKNLNKVIEVLFKAEKQCRFEINLAPIILFRSLWSIAIIANNNNALK